MAGRAGTSEEKTALVASEAAEPSSQRDKSLMFLKLTILVAVTLQNTGYALVRRYSRGQLKETYSTSSVLLAMEIGRAFPLPVVRARLACIDLLLSRS